jgi:signal transduction histidine kinase
MRRRARQVLGLRARLLAAVLIAVTIALGLLTAGFNILLGARLDADANDQLHSRATAALTSVTVSQDRVRLREAPDDTAAVDAPIWVFQGRTLVERPHVSGVVDRAATRLALTGGRRDDVGERARLLALPITSDGRRVGTVVAAVSLQPAERTERIALIASIALAAALLAAVALAARWLLVAGLRPVSRMTAQAADWSEHDLDRRFELGPPRDELTQLAATLDGLLARVAASVRREQRFSAELSHELRTPLARVRAQAQLALEEDLSPEQRESWAAVLRSTDEAARTLDGLLAAARAEANPTPGAVDARAAAEAAAQSCMRDATGRTVRLVETAAAARLQVGADPDLVERILHPVLQNACRYGRGQVRVRIGRDDGSVHFVVEDDGPGVQESERERIFEPAVRGRAAVAAAPGAGLGLALSRRLARAAGGDVEALPGEGGRFLIRLPAA